MVEHRDPVVLGVIDMFKWWYHSTKQSLPYIKMKGASYIRTKNILPKNKEVSIVSVNKDELEYLKVHLLNLDTEIQELEQSDLKKMYFTEVTYKISDLKKEYWTAEQRIKELEKSDLTKTKVLMTYRLFVKVVETYNKKVMSALVDESKTVKMWNNLGYLYIQSSKKTNPFSTKNIDWKASKEFKQELIDRGDVPKDEDHPEGKNWFQFYEDTDYLRVAWTKKYGVCKVPNNSVYAFYPTRSVSGIKKYLANAVKKNPYLKESFIRISKKSA